MQKGFGLIGILIVVALVAGMGVFMFDSVFPEKSPFTPSEEEKSAIDRADEIGGETSDDVNVLEVSPPNVDMTGWKTYRNEEYGFEVKYPSHIVVGRRASNSELGSVDNPVGGIFVGPLVFVVVNTPELKNLVELNIVERGGESCRAKILNFSSQIVEKLCGAGAGGFWVVRGDKYDVYVDGSSEGYEFPDDIGSFDDVNEMRQLLSTFKFIK